MRRSQRQVITSLIARALVAVGCVGAGGDAANSEVRDRIDDLGIDPSSSLLYDRRSS